MIGAVRIYLVLELLRSAWLFEYVNWSVSYCSFVVCVGHCLHRLRGLNIALYKSKLGNCFQ